MAFSFRRDNYTYQKLEMLPKSGYSILVARFAALQASGRPHGAEATAREAYAPEALGGGSGGPGRARARQ